MEPMTVLGISGSLRASSYNSAALRAAGDLMPEGMRLEIWDIAAIPMYNDDLLQGTMPAPIAALRDKLLVADATLIATPEYNYSVPGVLKNTLDWISRAAGKKDSAFRDHPVAIMGASTGAFGTVRAQLHLRQILFSLGAAVVQKPEVMIMHATTKFDADGTLTDEPTRGFIRDLMTALHRMARPAAE